MHQRCVLFLLILLLVSLPARLCAITLPDGFPAVAVADNAIYAIALQPDAKIVVGGQNHTTGLPYLGRLLPDGKNDPTFTPASVDNGLIQSLALQADGKILVGGSFTSVGGISRIYLARLNGDGTLDPSFAPATVAAAGGTVNAIVPAAGGGALAGGRFNDASGVRNVARLLASGSFDPQFPLTANNVVRSIVAQKDGKVLIAGYFTTVGGQARRYLARFNTDSTLDSFTPPVISAPVQALDLQSDGGMIIGGLFTTVQGSARNRMARLDKSGTLDPAFNPAVTGTGVNIYAVKVQPDGKILVGGVFDHVGGVAATYLARLKVDGTLDATLAVQPDSTVRALALQQDGKILAGGDFLNLTGGGVTTPRAYLARYYGYGTPDDNVTVSLNEVVNGGVGATSVQPNGDTLIGGWILQVNGTVRHRIARLRPDWRLDLGFNPDLDSELDTIVPLPDGRFLISGWFFLVGGSLQAFIARINNDGTLDPTFTTLVHDPVHAVAVQPDNRILIGGAFEDVNGTPRSKLARLDPNGNLDATFVPPTLDGSIANITLQPDGKILISGTFSPGLMRLNPDGSVDAPFQANVPTLHDPILQNAVYQIIALTDGTFIVVGIELGGVSNNRIFRLKSDGSPDPSFQVSVDDYCYTAALQTDGKILIGGRFRNITVNGTTYPRSKVARLNSDGSLDESFDLGVFTDPEVGEVNNLNILDDGKLVVGGHFYTINGVAQADLARIYNGFAAQELMVTNGGNEVRWMRSGTGPEVWRVAFEDSPDGVTWTALGDGTRIEGGWMLGGLSLPHTANRYLRAKGYALVGDRSSTANIVQSIRQYTPDTLTQSITFNALPAKAVGDADFDPGATATSGLPVTYTSSDPTVATIVDGKIHITGGGSSVITALQPGNDAYYAAPSVSQTLTVTKFDQTITFAALATKFSNDPDFALGATASSGLPVSYTSSDPTVATVTNGSVHLVSAGTTVITALQPGNGTFNAAPSIPQTLTVIKHDQSITFSALPTKYADDADFALTATASSGLPVSYTSSDTLVATVTNGSVHLVGAGTTVITAWQSGDGVFYAAAGVPQTLTVIKRDQTITFSALATKYADEADFTLNATASSSLPVSYTSSDPSVATVTNGVVHIVTAGSTVITASQGGNGAFNAAGSVPQTLTVIKHDQTISFPALAAKFADDADFPLTATASSSLTVSYTSSDPAVATVTNGLVHIIAAGSTVITASQSGNGAFNAATSVPQTLNVIKHDQSITFAALATRFPDDTDFALTATASSGLPVAYSSSDTSVATVSNGVVHIVAAGTTVITASQSGNVAFNAATSVQQTLTVIKHDQSITFPALATKYADDLDFTLGATASSSLTVSFTSSNPSVATVTNGLVHIVATGSTIITASQTGNGAFNAATSVQQTLTVIKHDQSITFAALGTKFSDDLAFALGATASSALSVSYSSSDTSVATITNGVVHILSAGTTVITASQPGNNAFNSATSISQILTVIKHDQTITFPAPLTKYSDDADFILNATASSSLPVTCTSADPSIATVTNGVVHIVAAGSTVITASQPGNGAFNAAISVQQTLTVIKHNQTITFSAIGSKYADDTDFPLTATASSTLPISYSNTNPSVATVINGVVHIVAAGSTVITASQSGNGAFNASTSVQQTLTVIKHDQTITFAAFVGKYADDADFTLNATASSNLPVTYTSADPSIATVTNGVVHIVAAGSTVITASQTGNGAFNAATSVQQTLTVIKHNQTITFPAIVTKYADDTDFALTATASSSLPVSYSSSDTTVATVSNGVVHILSAGTTVITASQSGNGAFNAATSVPQTLAVNKHDQTITFPALATKYADDTDFTLGATATSNLPISYASSNPSVATVTNGLVHIVAAGSTVITASQSGNSTYNAATSVQQTLTVVKHDQTITFQLQPKTYGDVDFNPGATSDSHLLVVYTSSNPAVATIVGGLIHISGAGTSSITASQGGNATYAPAAPVALQLTVAKAPLSVSALPSSRAYGTNNPTFTPTYSGFVVNETSASLTGTPLLTSTATASSPVGTYPITAAVGSLSSPNYQFLFSDGTLTVTSSQQSIDFGPLRAKTFGDGNFIPEATASSGLPLAFSSSNPTIAEIANGKIRIVSPGTTTITAAQSGNTLYDPAPSVSQTLSVRPPPGNALNFDGVDDVVTVPDSPQLAFPAGESFSIEAWLQVNGPQPDFTGILSKGSGVSPFSGYQLVIYQNHLAAEIGDGVATLGPTDGLVGTSALADGQWHHVALVVDRSGQTSQLYFDGRLEASVGLGAMNAAVQNQVELKMGVDRSGSHLFQGALDEVRIWDIARSQDQIRGDSSRILDPVNEPHLAGYFHFDEGDPSSDNAAYSLLPERTGNLLSGALTGFALGGISSNWVSSGALLPLLATAPVTNLTATGITGGADAYPNYFPPTDRGICWGTNPNPDLSGTCIHLGTGVGSFTTDISGLNPGTLYHLRGFATNAIGTAYGNEVTFSTNCVAQAISFPPLPTKYADDPDFILNGTASSGLPISYVSSNPAVATVTNGTIHILTAGTTVITASQPGNGTFYPAADVSQTLTVIKHGQTITFQPITNRFPDDPDFTLSANASSNLTVSYSSSDPYVATVINGTVHLIASGTTVITASQPGNGTFYPAGGVQQTLTVIKRGQTITFPSIATRFPDDPDFTLSASSSSNLPVSYSSSDPSVATVINGTVHLIASGTTVITASQPGNGAFSAAATVQQTLTVIKHDQSIQFPALPNKYADDLDFTLNASATSGLTISYSSSDPSVATITNGLVHLIGAGTTVITVSQTGNGTYHAAISASQTLTVIKHSQTVTLQLPPKTYGDADFDLGATSDSRLQVTYSSSNPAVATITGGLIHIVGAGTADITTSQTGNASYYPATPVTSPLTVAKAPLVVSALPATRTYGTGNPSFSPAYSGFVLNETTAKLTGAPLLTTTVNTTSPVGTYPISVAPGTLSSPNYRFLFTDSTLTITSSEQSIDFGPLRAKNFGDGDFAPTATSSSGLPIIFSSSDPTVADVVNGRIRIITPGRTEITAAQPGNALFDPASNVTQTLVVRPPPGNALSFDGADDVVFLADSPRLAIPANGSFSIEAWLHAEGAQPDFTGIISKGNLGAPGGGYQLITYQNHVAAEIGDGTWSIGPNNGLVGTGDLADGLWHHVALVLDRDGESIRLYFDGRLEAAVGMNGRLGAVQNQVEMKMGVDLSGTHFFQGELDEVRIWDIARTSDQVKGESAQILDPLNEPHLAGYFHFDEGDPGQENAAFSTLPERTGNLLSGVLTGFALNGASSNWVRSGAFLPLLETAPVSNLTATGATVGADSYPNYFPPTDRGLCWGTATNPDLSGSCIRSGSGAGTFTADLSGLSPGTLYHLRGFATNAVGTTYGNEVTFTTGKLDQSTSFPSLPAKTYGDPDFSPGGTSSRGLPLSYASSEPAVAAIVNGRIHITGAGTAVITASQGGDQTYNQAGAVAQILTINKAPLLVKADDQTRAYKTSNPVLTATYSGFVNGEGMAAVNGSCTLATAATEESAVGSYPIVTGLGSLAAANYRFVLQNGALNVIQSCQEIIFPEIGERTYGDPPFPIVAHACSGLNLVFSSPETSVIRIDGNLVSIVGAGSATITASQGGNGDVNGATAVSQGLVVHRSGQSITFGPITQRVLGDSPFAITASATSGLAVSFKSSDPSVATVSGTMVTLTGVGTTVLSAEQTGDGNYEPAPPQSQPLTVIQEGSPPLLTLSTLPFGAVTPYPVLNVEGLATDISGIASITVNGKECADQGVLFSSAVPLGLGENIISVIARDSSGNRSTDSRTISLDPTVPTLDVSLPADNSTRSSAAFDLHGMVAPGASVTFSLNGAPSQTVTVDGNGAFLASGTLVQGLNTLQIAASIAGRSTQVKRSITLEEGKPDLAITTPPCDIKTDQGTLTIKGSAGGGNGAIKVVLDVNGQRFTPAFTDGAFQQDIPLGAFGEYRIKAMATDSYGNSGVARRNVIRVAPIAGDLDGNGAVDLADAVQLLRISLGLRTATAQELARGDVAPLVNGVPQPDGKIDVGDVVVVLRKIVGLVDF